MAPPVTRAVRLLSSMHGSVSQIRQSGGGFGLFTPEHFPKTLAGIAITSTFAGFYTMEILTRSSEEEELSNYIREHNMRTANDPHLVRRMTLLGRNQIRRLTTYPRGADLAASE